MKSITKEQQKFYFISSLLLIVFGIIFTIYCSIRIFSESIKVSPSLFMCLLSAMASTILAVCAIKLWKTKSLPYIQIAVILLALIPETWLWYGEFISDSRMHPLVPLCTNMLFWTLLCALFPYSISGKIKINSWLIIFFIKSFSMIMSATNLFRAPWFADANFYLKVLLSIPMAFVPFYQMFTLGCLWRWKEKEEKRIQNDETP